ncbi:MAG: phosphatidylserine/phosphatidylglycerophosphate/cardiolipin synthase-like enzyme, partial [Kiritimatiellia bacterium]
MACFHIYSVYTGYLPVVDTATVVRGLFEEAQREVIIASYVFHNAKELLAPLASKMDADEQFKVQIVVDLSHARTRVDEPLPVVAGRFKTKFLAEYWQANRPPEFWHDPRVFEMADRTKAGVMHAKVVIIDHAAALVTSANF